MLIFQILTNVWFIFWSSQFWPIKNFARLKIKNSTSDSERAHELSITYMYKFSIKSVDRLKLWRFGVDLESIDGIGREQYSPLYFMIAFRWCCCFSDFTFPYNSTFYVRWMQCSTMIQLVLKKWRLIGRRGRCASLSATVAAIVEVVTRHHPRLPLRCCVIRRAVRWLQLCQRGQPSRHHTRHLHPLTFSQGMVVRLYHRYRRVHSQLRQLHLPQWAIYKRKRYR